MSSTVDLAVCEHLPDGTASLRIWVVDRDRAEALLAGLGEPDVQQLMTAGHVRASQKISVLSPVVLRGDSLDPA